MIGRVLSILYAAGALAFAVEATNLLIAGSIAVAVVAIAFAGCCLALALDYWPAGIMTRRRQS